MVILRFAFRIPEFFKNNAKSLLPMWLIDFGSTGCSMEDLDWWSFSPVCLTDDTFSTPLFNVTNEPPLLPPINDEDVDEVPPPPPPLPLLLLLL